MDVFFFDSHEEIRDAIWSDRDARDRECMRNYRTTHDARRLWRIN